MHESCKPGEGLGGRGRFPTAAWAGGSVSASGLPVGDPSWRWRARTDAPPWGPSWLQSQDRSLNVFSLPFLSEENNF